MQAPYQRIVAEIRRRIAGGELKPGDRVPSTRQITEEWQVAMATATKALTTLAQEGLVRPMPGIGTVVSASPSRRPVRHGRTDLVRAAIDLADAEGLAALSMRRLATELGTPTMSLYRHVRDKEQLIELMIDEACAEDVYPDPPPQGWRARLEALARLEWAGYRRHPWLAQVLSFTRPAYARNAVARSEWALASLDGLGLDANTMLHVSVTVSAYVNGIAINLEPEAGAERDTGLTDEEWLETRQAAITELITSGRFPYLAHVLTQPGLDYDLDTLMEFGLTRLLDGLDVMFR